MTDQQINDLMTWVGVSVTADVGCFTGKVIDGLMWKQVQYKNHDELLQDFNFLKSLESKMIEELKIVRMEWRLTPDRSQVTIIYMKHYYHLAEIEVEGSGSTEREAIINAIINYRRGK